MCQIEGSSPIFFQTKLRPQDLDRHWNSTAKFGYGVNHGKIMTVWHFKHTVIIRKFNFVILNLDLLQTQEYKPVLQQKKHYRWDVISADSFSLRHTQDFKLRNVFRIIMTLTAQICNMVIYFVIVCWRLHPQIQQDWYFSFSCFTIFFLLGVPPYLCE